MTARPAPAPSASVPPAADPMPLLGIDHVELWVGNAQQAAYFYERAFGFRRVGYRGLETGARDRTSYALHQGRVRLVLTGALGSGSPIAAHQRRHGDAVKVIALAVPDATHAHDEAVRRGARSVAAPRRVRDEHGTVALADHRRLRRHPPHVRDARRPTTAPSSPATRRSRPTARRADRRR